MHIADLFLTKAQAAHVIHVTTPVTDAKKIYSKYFRTKQ